MKKKYSKVSFFFASRNILKYQLHFIKTDPIKTVQLPMAGATWETGAQVTLKGVLGIH